MTDGLAEAWNQCLCDETAHIHPGNKIFYYIIYYNILYHYDMNIIHTGNPNFYHTDYNRYRVSFLTGTPPKNSKYKKVDVG